MRGPLTLMIEPVKCTTSCVMNSHQELREFVGWDVIWLVVA